MQPAFAVNGCGRGIGHLEIAEHHVIAAGAVFANLANRQGGAGLRVNDLDFDTRHRQPDGAGLVGQCVIRARH